MTTTTTFHGLGADNTLTVYADGANELLNQSVSMIQAYAHLLSLYDDESLLTMINARPVKHRSTFRYDRCLISSPKQ